MNRSIFVSSAFFILLFLFFYSTWQIKLVEEHVNTVNSFILHLLNVIAECRWAHGVWREETVIQTAAQHITNSSSSSRAAGHMLRHVPCWHVWRRHYVCRRRKYSTSRTHKAATQRLQISSNTYCYSHHFPAEINLLSLSIFCPLCRFSPLFLDHASSIDKQCQQQAWRHYNARQWHVWCSKYK